MESTHVGPLLRRQLSSLVLTGQALGASTPGRREGDLLLTPTGPFYGFGRISRAMARRELDSAYRWIGRSEMALSEEGVLVETGAPDQWANSFLRSTFDNGLAGWNTVAPGAATLGRTSPPSTSS
jgi:hypothetical protein